MSMYFYVLFRSTIEFRSSVIFESLSFKLRYNKYVTRKRAEDLGNKRKLGKIKEEEPNASLNTEKYNLRRSINFEPDFPLRENIPVRESFP